MTRAIGEVIPAGTGWAARVTRYGSGRKLPAPRILIAPDGRAWTSRLDALEALRTWADNPRACRQITRGDVLEDEAASDNLTVCGPAPRLFELVNHELDHDGEKLAHKLRRKVRETPPVVKLMDGAPAQNVHRGGPDVALAGVAVTRCPTFGRRSLSLRRRWSGRIVGGLVG